MSDPKSGEDGPDPSLVRFLRLLVTVLTGVMIVGLLTIIALFVIRFRDAPAPVMPALPDSIALPAGVEAQSVTFGAGWLAVVTPGGEALVYDSDTGMLLRRVRLIGTN